jgi:hypothetical protein
VLRRQVQKGSEEDNESNRAITCDQSVCGTPKNTDLKRAFIKLWGAYEKSLKIYVTDEKKKANIVHRTPSLSYQLNGKRAQDLEVCPLRRYWPNRITRVSASSTSDWQMHPSERMMNGAV